LVEFVRSHATAGAGGYGGWKAAYRRSVCVNVIRVRDATLCVRERCSKTYVLCASCARCLLVCVCVCVCVSAGTECTKW
jgi:hypothetical protein